jgi:DNA topoisomerase-1
VIGLLQKKAKNAATIYIATDPDREGEAIAEHVKEILGDEKPKISKSKMKRIVFHEITKGAVEEAMKNPHDVDGHLVDAQIARRVLDRLVGYKLSPLLWKKVRRGLSAGRVQSVAVRLIVEREKEIEKFKAEEYWEIFVEVEKAGQRSFIVQLAKVNDKKAEVHSKKDSDKIVSNLDRAGYKVLDVRKKEVSKNPYPPFTTSTMTQAGARLFGWSAKKTMSVAQKLYEEGLITYHRTDSTNIAEVALKVVREYIQKNYGENYLPEKPRFYKTTSKVAQEAHEAIRPTDVNVERSKLQITDGRFMKESEMLYGLIWKRFVACQMNASVYDDTKIDVLADHSNSKYILRASGQVMKFDGWRKVLPAKSGDEEAQVLPEVQKDDPLKKIKVDPQQKFTQPPARYNEASLIKTLEKLGIGRPSTYAPIISTIKKRQYVEKDEGKFKPTPIGVAVNEFLTDNFDNVVDYQFTAGMENSLDEVANGKMKWQQEIGNFYKPFDKKLKSVEKNAKRVKIEAEKLGKKCPDCKKGELVIRTGRFGKFISCSRFPDCKYTAKYEERIGMKCPDCKEGNVIVKMTKTGRKFFGCSRYPDCKWASWTNPKQKGKKKQ